MILSAIFYAVTQMWQFYYLATHFLFLYGSFCKECVGMTPAAMLARLSWSRDAV